MSSTGRAFLAAGGDPAKLTARPVRIVRETLRTADGRMFVNGQEVAAVRRKAPPLYEGSWGWLFWVKDMKR